MKKRVCYLLTVICSLLFFISCENNSPEDIPLVIKGGIFEGDRLVLTINGEVITGSSVDVRSSYGYKSDMIIQGFKVEGITPSIPFTVETIANGLQISGSLSRGTYEVEVEGTILKSGSSEEILILNVMSDNHSELIGNWVYKDAYLILLAGEKIHFEGESASASEVTGALLTLMDTYMPHMEVLSFQPNGDIDVEYTLPLTGELVSFPKFTTYYVENDYCCVELIDVLHSTIDLLTRENVSIPHELLFWIKPHDEDGLLCYTDKWAILSVSQALGLFVNTLAPYNEEVSEAIKKLYYICTQADTFEIGFFLQRKGS